MIVAEFNFLGAPVLCVWKKELEKLREKCVGSLIVKNKWSIHCSWKGGRKSKKCLKKFKDDLRNNSSNIWVGKRDGFY